MFDVSRFARPAAHSGVACLLFLVLTACGGGGGGGGGSSGSNNNPEAPPPAPSVAHAYFPTDAGVEWVYNENIRMSFSSFKTSKGATVHSLNYPNGGKEYFVTAADQISLQGLFLHSITVGDGIVYTGDVQFDSPLPILLNSWTPSFTQEVSGKGSIDVSPTYGKQKLTYSGTVAYIGDDDLSTPLAGFNTKSLMIRLTLSVTVQGQTFDIPYEVDLEIAEGVGIVRRKQGDVTYEISSMTGFDTDRDGVYGAADQYPDNVGLWEAGPLYASDDGIAFTSLPSYNRLTQTVTIMAGNRAAPGEWSASSDQSWLTVTPLSDGELQLTADPAGLAADALYYATVSVAQSSGADQHAPASIRVALWVGSQDAAATATLPTSASEMAADPLRPYVYVNNGGSSIDIYNIYTQTLVDSIPTELTGYEDLRVSTDGSFLFAGGQALHRIALDAPYAQSSSEDVIAGLSNFAYARPQGHPILVDGRGYIFDGVTLKTIDRLWIQGREFGGTPQASVLGNRACVATNGYFVADPILSCFELAYVSAGGGDIRFKRTGTRELGNFSTDFALRDDGEYAYLLQDGASMVEVYETWRPASPAYLSSTAFATQVEVDADGIVYSGSNTIVGVDSSNIPVSNLPFAGYDVRVSGDGAVMLGVDGGGLRLTRTYGVLAP
jgi:hypothetical protein